MSRTSRASPGFARRSKACSGRCRRRRWRRRFSGSTAASSISRRCSAAWIADRWIGQRNAVVVGAVLMSAGHLAMAFDQSFLVALALLIVGCGLLKGNISAQVGALYPVDDETNRVRGYAIFSMGDQCRRDARADRLWIAGAALRLAYRLRRGGAVHPVRPGDVSGRLSSSAGARGARASVSRALTAAEWRRIRAICAVLAIVVFPSTSYFQSFNTAAVWTQDHVNLDLGGFAIPVPWFNSVDPIFSILGVPVVFALWRLAGQSTRRRRTGRSRRKSAWARGWSPAPT